MGVIDGHDVRALRRALREALAAERPVVVHCATVKGKGFAPAEEGGLEGMEKWHAAKPKSIANGAPRRTSRAAAASAPARSRRRRPYTQVFGEALVRECRRDERVIGITAAMNSGTGLNILQRELPDRYFDVGIAEQQAVLFASGLALQGCKPVAAIYSTFLQRAYDQIVHDVCLQKLNVVFAMDRAGLVGDDGPTHHGAFDIAYLRCLPNIVLMAPRDEAMLVHMLHTALRYDDGPGRAALPAWRGRRRAAAPRPDGSSRSAPARSCGEGERVALLGYGSGVGKALEAADILAEHGISVTVADARFAKPIDAGLAAQLAAEHDLLVTVEEGVLAGGFGSAVWETLSDAGIGGRAADPARRPARPLRHARRARAPARGGRVHRRADRRADRGRGGRAQRRRLTIPLRPRRREFGWVRRSRTVPSRHMKRVRLDHLLSERGMFPSRTRAAASVLAGEVLLLPERRRAEKPGQLVPGDVELELARGARVRLPRRDQARQRAGSRSGLDVAGRAGARRRRLDGRLHRLPAQARRRARDRARRRLRPARLGAPIRRAGDRDRARATPASLTPTELPYAPDLIVIDVSFISLTKVLGAVLGCAAARFDCLALVKPQFEVGRAAVGKGGVVRDPELRRGALVTVGEAARSSARPVLGLRELRSARSEGQPRDLRLAGRGRARGRDRRASAAAGRSSREADPDRDRASPTAARPRPRRR